MDAKQGKIHRPLEETDDVIQVMRELEDQRTVRPTTPCISCLI